MAAIAETGPDIGTLEASNSALFDWLDQLLPDLFIEFFGLVRHNWGMRRGIPIRLSAYVALAVGLVACASDVLDRRRADQPSKFQQILNAAGIPFMVPPKGKSILVNIPSFQLIAFEDATPVFRSAVIIGTPKDKTPILNTSTRSVRFRPTWRPTASMIASGKYRDEVWPAGPDNPLGLAAVHLDTNVPIYLHDTNRLDLFAQDYRALSHGCIRVKKWDQLVSWLLDMPLEEVARYANGSRTFDIATDPVPVRVAYLLEFPASSGEILVHGNIYNLRPVGITRSDFSEPALPCRE